MAIGTINGLKRRVFQKQSYSYAYSNLAAGGTLTVTAKQLNMSNIAGYTAVAFTKITTGNQDCVIRSFVADAADIATCLLLKNVSTVSQSGTVSITILYIANSIVTGGGNG